MSVLIIVVLITTWILSDKIAGVEANTELIIHRNVATSGHRLHECLGANFGDNSQIVDHLVLGHANAKILNGDDEISSSGMILMKKFGCASIFSGPVMDS